MNNKDKTKKFKKRLYAFVLRLIKFIEILPENKVTKIIGNQLLRSGTSILGNYIEGLSASSRKDYTHMFTICLKSSNESKVWIAILRDTEYADKNEANYLLNELEEYSQIFASSILTLKEKKST